MSPALAVRDTERIACGRTTGALAASCAMKLQSATPWRAGLSQELERGLERQKILELLHMKGAH